MSQRLRCEVTRVIDHGGRVYSIFLRPDAPAPRFVPGQFLHLALDPYRSGDFWPDSRVFSIASSPDERDHLRITYSVKGVFTSRMEAELIAGGQVWVKLPYGEFTIARDTDVCLLAGGTGITAFTAFLCVLPADHPHAVDLIYGAREPKLLVYRPLVQEAEKRCPKLQVHYLAERDDDGTGCTRGRLDVGTIGSFLRAPRSQTYYLSGPPPMLTSLRRDLERLGAEPDRILVDAWD